MRLSYAVFTPEANHTLPVKHAHCARGRRDCRTAIRAATAEKKGQQTFVVRVGTRPPSLDPPSFPFVPSRSDKVHVDIRAATPAQARMARALLQTHFKSRSELLRLEHARRSMEGSLSAFEARQSSHEALCTVDMRRSRYGSMVMREVIRANGLPCAIRLGDKTMNHDSPRTSRV